MTIPSSRSITPARSRETSNSDVESFGLSSVSLGLGDSSFFDPNEDSFEDSPYTPPKNTIYLVLQYIQYNIYNKSKI